MSYENDKLMSLEDGQLLLSAVDKRKADIISVSDTTPSPVKTLTDGADGMPMALTVGIEPVQAGSGDPSPSNVRAISGWSAVKISRMSNLLDESVITLVTGKSIDPTTGSISNTQDYNYVDDYIPVVENEQYTLSVSKVATGNARGVWGIFYDKSKQYLSGVSIYANTTSAVDIVETFTVPSGARYARFDITKYTTGTLKLAKGTTTDNVTNGGNQYEITIPSTPGTVFGGSLTVNKDGTGKLVVTHGMTTIPEITEFHDSTSGTGKCVWVSTSGTNTNVSSFPPICENVKGIAFVSRGAAWTASISTTAGRTLVFVPADLTIAEANTALQGSKIVYRRATPAEYTLTAEQVNAIITSLKGVNNIYADSGDVLAVDYVADTKLYVDEHNAEEDSAITSIKGMIADSDAPVTTESHDIGDVFICSDQLLRATSVIAAGEAVSTGTGGNAEVLNLTDFINEKDANLQTEITNNASKLTTLFKIYPTPEAPLEKFGDDFTASVSYGVTHSKVGNVYYLNGTYSNSTYRNYSIHYGTVKAASTGSTLPSYDEKYVPFSLQAGVRHCLKIHFPKFVSTGDEGKRAVIILMKANSENTMSWSNVVTVNGQDTEYFFTPSEGDRYGLIVKIRGTTMDMAIETTIMASPETT